WQEMQPPTLNRISPFAGLAVWAGTAVSGLGTLSSQNALKPSTASNARLRRFRFETNFSGIYPLGRRNFSWQSAQAFPRAGKAALKLASSVVAATAVRASTHAWYLAPMSLPSAQISGFAHVSMVAPSILLASHALASAAAASPAAFASRLAFTTAAS